MAHKTKRETPQSCDGDIQCKKKNHNLNMKRESITFYLLFRVVAVPQPTHKSAMYEGIATTTKK